MAGRQARRLTDPIIKKTLSMTQSRKFGKRDQVIILLSVRAGLRACEIARLDWSMVLDANGRVGSSIALPDRVAKMGSGRRIPMHPDLRKALTQLAGPTSRIGPVVISAKGGHLRPNSIVNWFTALFAEVGAEGCSSHSGRRTFITNAARNAHRSGATLRDVQLLAGHKSIEVTQRYIDGDSDAQRRLVNSL